MSEDNEKQPTGDIALSAYEKQRLEHLDVKIGEKDSVGNTIFSVYATGDEFAIYSIDPTSSIKGIRVWIETIDPVDKKPVNNFQAVKGELDKLKALSNRCADSSYASRVSHALTVAMTGNPDHAKEILSQIATEISKDYQERVWGKLIYLTGILSISFAFSLLAVIAYIYRYSEFITANKNLFAAVMVCTFATYGGVVSVSINLDKIVVDSGLGKYPYLFYGAGRAIFSIFGGALIFLLIRANLVIGFVNSLDNPFFGLCAVGFLAGFSETFVPNTLRKLEDGLGEKRS